MTQLWKLSERSVIRINGEEAAGLLQGIVTNDVHKLALRGDALFAAMLSPQGKLLFDFFIIRDDEGFLLDVYHSQQEALLQKLSMYKLRAKVSITAEPSLHIYAGVMDRRVSDVIYYEDTRLPDAPMRCITLSDTKLQHNGSDNEYNEWRISQGLPEAAKDAADGGYFPLELGYDLLHAIDFKKGCYVGQEVTARSHYRGNVRKVVFKVQSTAPLPAHGTEIRAGEKRLGEMLSSSGEQGLALLRREDTFAVLQQGGNITADELEITVTLPRWNISSGETSTQQTISTVTE